jgi:hypothetical protein
VVLLSLDTGIFLSPRGCPDRFCGPFLERAKRPEPAANHLPPYNAEIKNAWIYISTPSIKINGRVLRHRESYQLPLREFVDVAMCFG